MAEKTIPTVDPKAFADTATKAVEDVLSKAQSQYLTMLSETQNLTLDAYRTVAETVAKMNLPAVPGLEQMTEIPAKLVEGAFDFGSAVLESQREFAKKIFEVSAV
jgi:hypothetical protein